MSEVTSPIITDSTGQQILNVMRNIGNDAYAVHYYPEPFTPSETYKAQARLNIGASNFSGSYNDLTNKPTIPEVVNGLNSTETGKSLSANMGRELNNEILNLKNIGRFLAIWNCVTGLPTSNPQTLPYTYKTGDYFRVGQISETTNYMPNGSSYDGTASSTEYTGTGLAIGAVFYYDGSTWNLQASGGGGTVQDVQIDGTSILSGGIADIPLASTSSAGAMSAAQNDKLAGIEAGANNYVLPQATSAALGGIKVWHGTQAQYDAIATKDSDTYYFITE